MVTEQTDSAPEVITAEQFREFQANADRRYAELERRYEEERTINDEAYQRVDELTRVVNEMQAKGMEGEDPRVVEAIRQRDAAAKRVRDLELASRQWGPRVRDALVEAATMRLTRGDETAAKELRKQFSGVKNEAQILEREAAIRAGMAGRIPAPTPRTGEEVDAGRGRGGSGNRITAARVAEIRASGDTKAWEEISDEYWSMLKAGKPIPER